MTDEQVEIEPVGSSSSSGFWVRAGVLAFLGLGAASAYLTRHCIAVANTTIQDELRIDAEEMGWVLAAFSAGYFVFQIPGGWLGNRIGTRAAYPLISGLWSLLTIWSSLAFSWAPLVVSRAAFGAAQAGMVPITAKIISDWFPDRLRGFCSSIVGAAMSVGGVVTVGLTGLLLTHFGWREIFRMYSLVGILWAIAFYWFFRTKPEEHPWIAAADNDAVEPLSPAEGEAANGQGADEPRRELSLLELLARIATNRTLWGINVQSFFRAAGYTLFVTWFPAFLEYRFGMTAARAGALTMYPLAGVIAGTLAGGAAVDGVLTLTGNRWLSRTGIASLALGLCGTLTFLSSWADGPGMFILLMSAGAFLSGLANPPAWAATMDVAGRHTAVIVGAMNMAGTIGAFALPVVLGYLIGDIQKTGGDWNLVIYFDAAIYVAGAVSWLAVDPNDSAE